MSVLPTGTVTFLFTDIEGSTRMWEEDETSMREALARHDGILARAADHHGGHVFKTVGDAFCCAFPAASGALEAALSAQRALQAEPWGEGCVIRVRMALHAGAAEERDGDYFGPPVNRVARLLSAGHGGQTLLSHSTHELVDGRLPYDVDLRDMGERRLKDLTLPERVFQLIAPDLPADFPPLNTLDARSNNLPAQPTPLVGRVREVEEICERLRSPEVRLLTLTGPGGTGKTRLGLQAAAEVLDEYEGGAFFVALDAVRDPAFVASAIAQPVGVTEGGERPLVEELEAYLGSKQLLLVLDNFEQVLGAAPLVGELLARCPRLKVLVTSRAALRVYGEHEYPVPPLALPDPTRPSTADRLGDYEAVRLFVERAHASSPGFRLTDENARDVAEICARLDGLPLAVELAAARSKLLSPRSMLNRLDNRLRLLRGGAANLPARQQTLRGAMDWSHGLLGEQDKALFRRLSVFNGGFTLEAADEVCDTGGLDVLDGVESLLDMSLLRREEGGEDPRFHMLQTIREFALERLHEAEEDEELSARHAEHYLALAEEAEPDLYGPRAASRAEELETEHDNLRAALSWSLAGGHAGSGLRTANALWWFWHLRGHYTEGRRWLKESLARAREAGVAGSASAAERAMALGRAGFLAVLQTDIVRAGELSREGLALARGSQDDPAAAVPLLTLGYVALFGGDHEKAGALFGEALGVFRRLGNGRDVGWALFGLGTLERFRGDNAAAKALYEEALALFEVAGDGDLQAATAFNLGDISMLEGDFGRAKGIFTEALASARKTGGRQAAAVSAANLGLIALFEGDHDRATAFLHDGLALSQDLGHRLEVVNCLEPLAALAGARGEPARAARLWGAAEALREAIGSPISPADLGLLEPYLTEARARLGEAGWRSALAEGQVMTYEAAVSYAAQSSRTRTGPAHEPQA